MEYEKQELDTEACLGDLNRTLKLLEAFSMIRVGEDGIFVHSLVQMVTRDKMEKNDISRFNASFLETLCVVFQLFNRDMKDYRERNICREWILHGEIFLAHFKKMQKSLELNDTIKVIGLFEKLWGIHQYDGQFKSAEQLAIEGMILRKTCYNECSVEIANGLDHLGLTLSELGAYHKALKCQQDALIIRKSFFGEQHFDVALSLNNVGLALFDLKRHPEALHCQIQALKIIEDCLGKQHLLFGTSLKNVGRSLRALGRHREALHCQMQALKIIEDCLGKQHPDIISSLNEISTILKDLKYYEKALYYQMKALQICEICLNENHPNILVHSNNVGCILILLEQYEKALTYLKRAIKMSEFNLANPNGELGVLHNQTPAICNSIAICLRKLDREQEAQKYEKIIVQRKVINMLFDGTHDIAQDTDIVTPFNKYLSLKEIIEFAILKSSD